MQQSLKMAEGRISELDGWRGICVLMVIAYHYSNYAYVSYFSETAVGSFFLNLFHQWGPLGVKIFFVISGFVITRLLLIEEAQNGRVLLTSFYVRRIFRILPAFYFFLAVVIVLDITKIIQQNPLATFLSATFLSNTLVLDQMWFTGHSWSLSVEEQFYLIFPLLFRGIGKTKRPVVFIGSFCIFMLLSLLHGYLRYKAGPNAVDTFDNGLYFACINAGMLMALNEAEMRAWVSRISPMGVALLLGLLFLRPLLPAYQSAAIAAAYLIITPISIAVILMATIEAGQRIKKLFNYRLLQWLGSASYSIYLWQQLCTSPSIFYKNDLIAKYFHLPLLILLFGTFSYIAIEKPFNRLGRRLYMRRL